MGSRKYRKILLCVGAAALTSVLTGGEASAEVLFQKQPLRSEAQLKQVALLDIKNIWRTVGAEYPYIDGLEEIGERVLQRIADPCFIGATIQKECVVGAKVVKKNAPDEKVGVICLEDGRPSIVEYYELTEELMTAKDANGDPAYYFGVILNYLFNVEELELIWKKNLPLHIVEKKIPYLNEAGELVKPEEPNGYKFESLILDMIHQMSSCLPFDVAREREFAPIKNKTGIDSVESARALLQQNGVVL